MAQDEAGAKEKFAKFFLEATEAGPYPYQIDFATTDKIPQLLRIPTGAGKTATAILGWLFRRQTNPDETPRRLVYCLPMRVLVEQTEREARKWINDKLKLDVNIQVLMGGAEISDWYLYPEKTTLLIGTQDMLLSRALNRGYAASRFHWPIDFALLNNDCLWVFDEPQLMGSGVSTSAQLAGLRESLGVQFKCQSMWMSATLEPSWLDTIDFRDKRTGKPFELTDADYDPNLPLHKKMTAAKKLQKLDIAATDAKTVAAAVMTKHQEGTQTLVIVNTVDRAKDIYSELVKLRKKSATPELLLVHSRFRPAERSKLNERLQTKPSGDRIIVATQVVEAGVDISSRTLVTDLAPWASMVQRIGRCNRTGDDGTPSDPANVFWIDLPEKSSAPYEFSDLKFSRKQLAKLEGKNVSPKALDDFKQDEGITLPFEHIHVLRRRDLIDLFDTTPDLSGNDIDIDRFVRDADERNVQVFWRKWDRRHSYAPPDDKRWRQIGRDELCAAPVDEFRDFIVKNKGNVWQWNQIEGDWIKPELAIPGQTYLIHADAGGYDPLLGWGIYKVDFRAFEPPEFNQRDEDDFDDDGLSMTDDFERINQHTDKVFRCLELIVEILSVPQADVLRLAARWHDFGKAHKKFQIKIDDGQELTETNPDGSLKCRRARPAEWTSCRELAKAPGKRWNKTGELIDLGFWRNRGKAKDGFRKHFRHELASALAVLQRPHDDLRGLSDTDLNLVAYLVAAHHGKVRLSIRSMPKELMPRTDSGVPRPQARYARGVWDEDELPETDLGDNTIAPKITLSLEPMELGLCEQEPFVGQLSWVERTIQLRNTLGPFRLAYLEALLRAADMRASIQAKKGEVNP